MPGRDGRAPSVGGECGGQGDVDGGAAEDAGD